jgi:acyl-CoA thioester hydrolase
VSAAGATGPASGATEHGGGAANPADGEPHETSLRVRYVETDAQGIVHHSRYLAWFEVGRTEWLRARGLSYRALEDQGFRLAIVDVKVRYRAPARYDDLVTVRTALVERTHVTLRFRYEVARDGTQLCDGETRLACVDPRGRPQRLPDLLAE